ncbi:MAG: dipeptide epimerase [Chlorobia bacterium]|nr:dipeptide epimerase [Fimbriimonadaceae bacterium]
MSSSENLFVEVSDGTHTGIGELSPATGSLWTAERGEEKLNAFVSGRHDHLELYHPSRPDSAVDFLKQISTAFTKPRESELTQGLLISDIWRALKEWEVDPPAMAALDVALWDLHAKRAQMPLYQLLGLSKRQAPTSITIGLNPPEVTKERVPDILRRTGAKYLKVKLGSPEGREHDKAHFLAAAEAAKPFNAKLRVDANGGWTVDEAKMMMPWLAERDVGYVEQPLVEGAEEDLKRIYEGRPLPIFVDESCQFSNDIPKWAHSVDGINLKLMKCGGITEAIRINATAKAFGLKTMIGCMSESSIAIAAGAAIGSLFDHIDLDSHLNLNPDVAEGAPIVDGVITPTDNPGHGARLIHA